MMIRKYQNQIQKLAQELNCSLVVDIKFRSCAMMYVESGYVEVPPIENQIDYMINLHELGHVYHGHTQGRPPFNDKKYYFDNGILHSEAEAWEWALDKCIDDLLPDTRRFIWDICLGSYYAHSIMYAGQSIRLTNGNRHYVEFVYDKPDDYFSSIVERVQSDLINFNIPYVEKKL